MERHMTVSGFVVEGDRTLLHWHRKNSMWLPPGGHIERDEDPVQAVTREVAEETGITAEIVAPYAPRASARFAVPPQLPPPYVSWSKTSKRGRTSTSIVCTSCAPSQAPHGC